MKVKIVLRHGSVLALTDNEAQEVEIEIVGCDDCSTGKWAQEVDDNDLNEAEYLTVRIAKEEE